MSLTKIGSIGINTGIQFAGVTTVSTLHVGSGVTLSSDGDIFATGISTFSDDVKINVDSKKILLGAGADLEVFHNGTNSHLRTQTGNLIIDNNSGGTVNIRPKIGEEGVVCTTDGSTALYHDGTKKFETSSSGATVTGTLAATAVTGDGSGLTNLSTDLVNDTSPQLGGNLDVNTKNITFGDSGSASDDRLTFGAGTDLSIFHDGSNSYVRETGTGSLFIEGNSHIYIGKASGGAENGVVVKQDGAVELYHDNSKKLETTSTGVSITGKLETTTFISVAADNQDLKVGAGDDLKLFHDGSNSYIDNNTGALNIRSLGSGANVQIIADSDYMARFVNDGAVELYYDNSKKLETVADGVNLAGTNLVFQGSSNRLIKYRSGDNDMIYEFDAGDFMRQDIGNSRHEFFVGNYKQASVTGDGITFGSDTAAANALNKYEKGTFTPRFHGQGNNNTITTSTNVGEYVRIGRLVHVKLYVVFSNRNGANSVLAMDGLPFSNAGNYTTTGIGRWTGMQNSAVFGALVGYIGDGSQEITFNEILTSGVGNSDVNRVTDTTSVMLSFSYPVWNG